MGDTPAFELTDFPLLREARGHWDAGRLDAALGLFSRALDREPRNVKALLEAARAYGARHEVARAEELIARAEALAGDDPRVATAVAQSYRFAHRPARAVAALERLRALPAGLAPNMLAELATLYEQAGELEKAYEAIAACVDRAAGHDEPRLVLARIQRQRGELAEAERVLLDVASRLALGSVRDRPIHHPQKTP